MLWSLTGRRIIPFPLDMMGTWCKIITDLSGRPSVHRSACPLLSSLKVKQLLVAQEKPKMIRQGEFAALTLRLQPLIDAVPVGAPCSQNEPCAIPPKASFHPPASPALPLGIPLTLIGSNFATGACSEPPHLNWNFNSPSLFGKGGWGWLVTGFIITQNSPAAGSNVHWLSNAGRGLLIKDWQLFPVG